MSELTPEERTELMNLRARFAELQAKDNNSTPADAPTDNGTTLAATHWLHLADGSVITSNGVKSMHNGIQVIGCYEMPAVESTTPDHVF
jgi:hypothetical protein